MGKCGKQMDYSCNPRLFPTSGLGRIAGDPHGRKAIAHFWKFVSTGV
jgi:hypothetical protein